MDSSNAWSRARIRTQDSVGRGEPRLPLIRTANLQGIARHCEAGRIGAPKALFFPVNPRHKQLVTQSQHHRAQEQTDDPAGCHAAQRTQKDHRHRRIYAAT